MLPSNLQIVYKPFRFKIKTSKKYSNRPKPCKTTQQQTLQIYESTTDLHYIPQTIKESFQLKVFKSHKSNNFTDLDKYPDFGPFFGRPQNRHF
jgi:hypothetical protein